MDAIAARNSKNKTLTGSFYDDSSRKKKNRGSITRIVRAALYLIRVKSKSKSVQVDAASTLKNFVGSMRPLHIQTNQSPHRYIEGRFVRPVVPELDNHRGAEQCDVITPFMSPAHPSEASSSSSRYGSALNLQELDTCGDTDNEEYNDNWPAENDEMIDEKAEEFIARFYEQMRLQDQAYTRRHKRRV
ncbi:hypothetical protein K2173_025488 [Erythroxylum novogranatense]|uniref:Cotton fiber protein n=1 Tax=Erythroxylum novogranatense TaxID=1862640 RepID=A0AAV8SBL8_9ROSI|nr:hypothetical protein K2173_025488 [Erythroxylum novogranatense]